MQDSIPPYALLLRNACCEVVVNEVDFLSNHALIFALFISKGLHKFQQTSSPPALT